MIEDGVYKAEGPTIRESDRLTFAGILAIAFHAMLFLGIAFTLPEESSQQASPVMQVVLAQHHALEKPEKADFIGQDNQQGGGDKDLLQNPTTTEQAQIPDPNKQASAPATMPSTTEQSQPTPHVLTAQGAQQVFVDEQVDAPNEQAQQLMDTATLLQKSYELAGRNAQIDDQHQLASRNLRKRQVSAAIHRSTDALYLDNWRRRIEEVGNRNYPDMARKKKLYGDLILKVAINADGTIRDVAIMDSSGHKVLDDAAIRIVRQAAPFAPFDDQLKQDTDVLEIVRLWQFEPGNTISTL
ncbi:energy transducer TonB [Pleionea mediterranea]|uniref:Protein TonB n=1 Tax=Pleionea mediterranea TaxID=523701 RepID=A0A316FFN1_9GAMM|nr:energy transducer TonB [Pleionea mediterranea]PWK46872.1 protein TonB [Pleionea mediterranea]